MSHRGPYSREPRTDIASARLSAGLTQREAAVRACVSLCVYQRAEWGRHCTARVRALIVRALGQRPAPLAAGVAVRAEGAEGGAEPLGRARGTRAGASPAQGGACQ